MLHPRHLVFLLVRSRVPLQQFFHQLLHPVLCRLFHLPQVRVQGPVQQHRAVRHRALLHQIVPAHPAVPVQLLPGLIQGQVRQKIIPGLRVVQIAAHILLGSFQCFCGESSF